MKTKKLTLGIVAHVDAGKTTLSEAILYNAHQLRQLGRVDKGTSALDSDEIEKQRGITIYSREARVEVDGAILQFIDTPGHVDFGTEMERVLPVLDAAILVISGLSGVESQTGTLWRLLSYYQVPVFIFVNKMDTKRHSREEIFSELSEELSGNMIDLSADRSMIEEELALCNDELFLAFSEGKGLPEELVVKAFADREFFPVLYGSALKNEGVEELMQLVSRYSTPKETTEELGAYCYKVTREKNTRLVHLKLTGGRLAVRDTVGEDKVTGIRILRGYRQESVTEAEAGDVICAEGLDHVYSGDAIGECDISKPPMLVPVMSFQAIPPDTVSPEQLYEDMKLLGEEDPSLSVEWLLETKEVRLRLMGQVQLSVVTETVKTRFGYIVTFGPGQIMYRETITVSAEGIGHFEPLRHYAEVRLLLEPGERGSGITVSSECPPEVLPLNYQQQVLTTLSGYTHRGLLTGSPLTDVRITLAGGQSSNKHTCGGDFRKATIRAVRQGLMKAGSQLLEPWYRITLMIRPDAVGSAMNDLMQMGGSTMPPEPDGSLTRLTGEVPVSSFMEYSKRLFAYTAGPSDVTIEQAGYRPCHNAAEVIEEKAYDPEADTRNLPSSVFCFHGVGTNVPWYLVDSMAKSEDLLRSDERIDWDHTSEVLGQAMDEVEQEIEEREREAQRGSFERKPGSRKSSYQGYSGMSPELEEIFVREFGQIRHPSFNDVREIDYDRERSIRDAKEDYIQAHPAIEKKRRDQNKKQRYLIVDGYNVIFASRELSELFKENMDAARSKLVDEVENYQGFDGARTIVVFDAYKRAGGAAKEAKAGKVTVIYTKQDQTADAYIERFTLEHRDRDFVRVVTSDSAEQSIALGNGAVRVSAREFLEELRAKHL